VDLIESLDLGAGSGKPVSVTGGDFGLGLVVGGGAVPKRVTQP